MGAAAVRIVFAIRGVCLSAIATNAEPCFHHRFCDALHDGLGANLVAYVAVGRGDEALLQEQVAESVCQFSKVLGREAFAHDVMAEAEKTGIVCAQSFNRCAWVRRGAR